MRRFTPSLVAFTLVFVALAWLLGACGPLPGAQWQEPVTDVQFLPHGTENPVAFGASLHDHPEWRAQAIATIDSGVAGRLPGTRFYVVRYPALLGSTGVHRDNPSHVHSYREPWSRLIVLSWWIDERGAFVVGDVPWEVENSIKNVDDSGRPIPRF